jgi:hypothetical protein
VPDTALGIVSDSARSVNFRLPLCRLPLSRSGKCVVSQKYLCEYGSAGHKSNKGSTRWRFSFDIAPDASFNRGIANPSIALMQELAEQADAARHNS